MVKNIAEKVYSVVKCLKFVVIVPQATITIETVTKVVRGYTQ